MENTEEDTLRCTNCGTPVDDAFCPHCGQEVGPARLTVRHFLAHNLRKLFSIEDGFFYTSFLLLFKPWAVIRNYINGHRIPYTSPVSMLVALVIYDAVIASLLHTSNHLFHLNFEIEVAPADDKWTLFDRMVQCICDVLTSAQFTYIALSFIIVGAVYITYFRFGGRRFSITEYMVAAMYALSSVLLYDIFFLPLTRLVSFEVLSFPGVCLLIFMYVLSLNKAFKIKNIALRILLLLLCSALIAAFAAAYFGALIGGIRLVYESIKG